MTDAEREEIYLRGLLQVVYNYANTFGMNKEEVKQLAQEKGIPALTKQNYLDVRRAIQENSATKLEGRNLMTTRPIIRPKLDIVELTGAVGVTEEETVEKIKALELEIHRENTRGKLPEEIQPMRDDLVRVPGLGHQGALELMAHMGMFMNGYDKNNAGDRERHRRIKKQKLLRRAEKLNEGESAF